MSKINRSTYQKVCEENKRLLRDIEILTEKQAPPSGNYIICLAKWRKKFREQKEFNHLMKSVAKQYIKDHANELPEFLTRSINK